ncbi:MAG: TSUP family transporter, partial [Opitutales bacterium]
MLELSIWHWGLLVFGAWLTGLAKGGVPGAGIVTVAIFAWVLDQSGVDDGVRRSVGLLLPVLVAADVVAVLIYRRFADWMHLLRLLPWTFLGIIGGYFLFNRLSEDFLKLLIGAILLGLTALHFGKQYLFPRSQSGEESRSNLAWGISLGFLVGAATMLANAAGPVAALYLIVMRLPKYAFLGTSAWL